MNKHVTAGNTLCLLPGVSGMYSNYDRFYGPAVRVQFRNGYELSIVANPKFGRGARYAGGEFFEIAIFDPEGNFFEGFFGDAVSGWRSVEEIVSVGKMIETL